jgi:hypothetical protein
LPTLAAAICSCLGFVRAQYHADSQSFIWRKQLKSDYSRCSPAIIPSPGNSIRPREIHLGTSRNLANVIMIFEIQQQSALLLSIAPVTRPRDYRLHRIVPQYTPYSPPRQVLFIFALLILRNMGCSAPADAAAGKEDHSQHSDAAKVPLRA